MHTCDVKYAGTDGAIYVSADGLDWLEIDNPGHDDRERNRGDKYQVPRATRSFKIRADSSDGWCVDSISYGPVEVQLCADHVWLDKPCEPGYGPCFEEISFDPTTGLSSLCQPPPPSPPPPPRMKELKVHTCDVKYAGSDGSIYVQADGGAWTEIDHSNHDDRERNRGDKYQVAPAKETFAIKTTSSDGWCVDSISYGPVTVALCADQVWLDKPCEPGYGPCFEEISFDPTTGISSLCQPPPPSPPAPTELQFHTCDVKYAGSNGNFYFKDGAVAVKLDNRGDDRNRGKWDTYTIPPPHLGFFRIVTSSGDGWCIDKILLGGRAVDMSDCRAGGVWMDDPCSGRYDRECVGDELKIDGRTMKVTNC